MRRDEFDLVWVHVCATMFIHMCWHENRLKYVMVFHKHKYGKQGGL